MLMSRNTCKMGDSFRDGQSSLLSGCSRCPRHWLLGTLIELTPRTARATIVTLPANDPPQNVEALAANSLSLKLPHHPRAPNARCSTSVRSILAIYLLCYRGCINFPPANCFSVSSLSFLLHIYFGPYCQLSRRALYGLRSRNRVPSQSNNRPAPGPPLHSGLATASSNTRFAMTEADNTAYCERILFCMSKSVSDVRNLGAAP